MYLSLVIEYRCVFDQTYNLKLEQELILQTSHVSLDRGRVLSNKYANAAHHQ